MIRLLLTYRGLILNNFDEDLPMDHLPWVTLMMFSSLRVTIPWPLVEAGFPKAKVILPWAFRDHLVSNTCHHHLDGRVSSFHHSRAVDQAHWHLPQVSPPPRVVV